MRRRVWPWGQALDVFLNCTEKGMSSVQMLWRCTILWELAWNSNPQQVPSASTSATRVPGAIKAMLPTDSKGIWDHFLTSFHFIWCQRSGSLQRIFSSNIYSARTNECAYIFLKSQNKVCQEWNTFLQIYVKTVPKMLTFQRGFSEFLHFNQKNLWTEISLTLQYTVKNIPQILEEAFMFFWVQTMQGSETKAFYLSLK